MSKNIVVLSDGTGQEGGKGHDTNVYKLFRMLEDRTERQIVFYDQGIGTDQYKVTGSVAGAGFTENILQCYQFMALPFLTGNRVKSDQNVQTKGVEIVIAIATSIKHLDFQIYSFSKTVVMASNKIVENLLPPVSQCFNKGL